MDRQKNFFPLKKTDVFATIVFFGVSIFAFTPMVTNTMWNGINGCSWLLSALVLCVPFYNIIAAYMTTKKSEQ